MSLVGLFEKVFFDKSGVFKKCIMKKCFFQKTECLASTYKSGGLSGKLPKKIMYI